VAILIDDRTKVIVQGITGNDASLSTRQMLAYGTQVVGGVTPGKGGEWASGVPVFDTVTAAVSATGANTSIIFVPPENAADSMFEAINGGIKLIVCITEGIPVADMLQVNAYVRQRNCRLIGPNCPGVLSPGLSSVGIIPGELSMPGSTGVLTKSGTLTYEVVNTLTFAGYGQSTCVGIGNDPISGTGMVEVLELFEHDPDTERIVIVGEIGGEGEYLVADYIKKQLTKPVVAYIAGKYAPRNTQMGHRGAIIVEDYETADEKIKALRAAGARIANHLEEIPELFLSTSS